MRYSKKRINRKGIATAAGTNTERQFGAAPLPMLIAATTPKRRRLYLPVAVVENFGPKMLRYSPRQLASQPTSLSWRPRVEHDAPVKDSVSSWVCSRPLLAQETSFQLTQWREQPTFSQLSRLLPPPPAAICVSTRPVSPSLLASVFRVAGSFSLTSSAS
jgi:hypothetical protein